MRNLLTRLVVMAVMITAVAVPVTASANNDPSQPVPVASDTLNDPPLPVTPTPPPEPPHTPNTYTVGSYTTQSLEDNGNGILKPVLIRKVEDLAYIANKLNLTTDEIKYSNPDKDVTNLNEGDTLTVPRVHGVVYKVQNGDTLTWIAQSYSVDMGSIVSYNSIPDPDQISPGNVYVITGAKLPPIQPPTPVYIQPSPGTTYNPPSSPAPYSGSNHFYFGYCTWYVANRRPIPWFGDAIAWWPNARAYGYAEGRTPRPGAILVEYPNHVAYVESVNGSAFTVSEMNWSAFDSVDYRTIQDSDGSIVGFIY